MSGQQQAVAQRACICYGAVNPDGLTHAICAVCEKPDWQEGCDSLAHKHTAMCDGCKTAETAQMAAAAPQTSAPAPGRSLSLAAQRP